MPARRAHPVSASTAVWHLPPHAVMVVVMVGVMLPGSTAAQHLAGAGVLLLMALGLAPLARRRAVLAPVLLDLGVMAAVLVAGALAAPADGGHAHGGGLPLILLAAGVWLVGRLAVTRGVLSVATGVLSGAGVLAMALLG